VDVEPVTDFSPDFLFSTVTDVHFASEGGYVVLFYNSFSPATFQALNGAVIADSLQLPESQGGSGLGIAVAVFGQGKFNVRFKGVGDGSRQLSTFMVGEVFTNPPYDKKGQRLFSDYQGTDQTLRISFGVAPNQPQPNPDDFEQLDTGPGSFTVNAAVDVTKKGKGTVTLTDVTQQGG
jgi:hypothetical protein